MEKTRHGIGISIKRDRDRAGHPKHEGDVFTNFSIGPDISNRLFCGFIPRTFYLVWPLPYRSAINKSCPASVI
jgi:hypothetical protein